MNPESCAIITRPGEKCGLVEPLVDLGTPVRNGQAILRVHPVRRTGHPLVTYESALDGILAGRHFPGLVQAGDCLGMIAVPE